MVEREDKVEGLEDVADNSENAEEEGIVQENENFIEEKKEIETDDIEEVDGMFEPCTKTEYGGQLYKMMILNAGYKLAE